VSKLDDIERGLATGRGFQFMPHMQRLGRDVYVHESAHVEASAELGPGCIVWAMAYVMGGAIIGRRCMLGQSVHVGTMVTIGDGCSIQNGAQVFTGVALEDDVFLGPHCTFTNVLNPRAFQRAPRLKRTLVRRGASIGANATILCGVTIGEYAMIGAGTVVTRDVPAYTLVVGVPARESSKVCKCGVSLGPGVRAERGGLTGTPHWTCKSCEARYTLHPETRAVIVEGAAGAEVP
jgi:UDP-2-acetamido-3-amino-2,3-dideoxy-glucuronate N-acetyltransferase